MRIRDGIMDITMNTGVKQDNINKTGLSCIWKLKCILSFYFEFHIERKTQKGSNSTRIVSNSRQLIFVTGTPAESFHCVCMWNGTKTENTAEYNSRKNATDHLI